MTTRDSTVRFSDRADNYHLYRPGYPVEVISWLEQTIGLGKQTIIADIGSGTGIFSALFLEAGYTVNAVEPNAAMRAAAIKNLQPYKGFHNIEGTAEQTSLPEASVDLITVAQAFHWFDLEKAKKEFKRILKPGGHVLLVWNILQTDTPFLQAYNTVKEKYAEQNAHPDHADGKVIQQFFAPNPVVRHQIENIQLRSEEGLEGLLLSSSKTPLPGDSHYDDMIADFQSLSKKYAENGLLKLEYETKLYLSQLND